MALKMNLWSLTLVPGEHILLLVPPSCVADTPGQTYPLYVRRDFTITNAALGEDLRSNDGRSVVKVTHHPLPPNFGDSDSEFDSEIDSDIEIDSDEEQFELDTEEGFKLTPKKGKKAEEEVEEDEDDEEEDDEDEDDEEEDDDFSDDEVEETNVICALTAGRVSRSSTTLTEHLLFRTSRPVST